jgi:hypothetical protein
MKITITFHCYIEEKYRHYMGEKEILEEEAHHDFEIEWPNLYT